MWYLRAKNEHHDMLVQHFTPSTSFVMEVV